jgi:hypothetical protein
MGACTSKPKRGGAAAYGPATKKAAEKHAAAELANVGALAETKAIVAIEAVPTLDLLPRGVRPGILRLKVASKTTEPEPLSPATTTTLALVPTPVLHTTSPLGKQDKTLYALTPAHLEAGLNAKIGEFSFVVPSSKRRTASPTSSRPDPFCVFVCACYSYS